MEKRVLKPWFKRTIIGLGLLGLGVWTENKFDLIDSIKNNSIKTPVTTDFGTVLEAEKNELKVEVIEVSNDEKVITNLVNTLNQTGPYGFKMSGEDIFDAWLLANSEAVCTNSKENNKEYISRLNYLDVDSKELLRNYVHYCNEGAEAFTRMVKENQEVSFANIFNATEKRYEKALELENLLKDIIKTVEKEDKEEFDKLNEKLHVLINEELEASNEFDAQLNIFITKFIDYADGVAKEKGKDFAILSDVEQAILVDAQQKVATICSTNENKDQFDNYVASSPNASLANRLYSEAKKADGKLTRNDIVTEINSQMKKDTYKDFEVEVEDIVARVTYDENDKPVIIVGGFEGGAVPGQTEEVKEGTTTTTTTEVTNEETVDTSAKTDVVIEENKEVVEETEDLEIVSPETEKPNHTVVTPEQVEKIEQNAEEQLKEPEQETGKYIGADGKEYDSEEEMIEAAIKNAQNGNYVEKGEESLPQTQAESPVEESSIQQEIEALENLKNEILEQNQYNIVSEEVVGRADLVEEQGPELTFSK